MRLSCDILDLPELASTLAPTIRFEQEDVPSVKKTQKRRSLMSLRRERMRSTATLSNDVGTDGNRLRNESLPQRARMLAGHASSMTACAEPTLPCLTANTKCFLSWMPEHHEAKGALLCKWTVVLYRRKRKPLLLASWLVQLHLDCAASAIEQLASPLCNHVRASAWPLKGNTLQAITRKRRSALMKNPQWPDHSRG